MEFSIQELLPNVNYKTSRSGGKGGQNVNKVSSKVEIDFDFESSSIFDELEKARLRQKLSGRLNSSGMIQVISEEERSQYANKEKALTKLFYLIKNALHIPKARKATKPSRSSVEKRLKSKQIQAIKKLNRRQDRFD